MSETGRTFECSWILSDGKVGDLVQCEGVAGALDIEPETIIIAPARPWAWVLPHGPLPPDDRIGAATSPLKPPFPDLVIASGWRTLAYVREIKKVANPFAVFLKNPRINAGYLDLVWTPNHDRKAGENVISSLVGPHRYSPLRLASEFAELPETMRALPRPLIAVLLGGDSLAYRFSEEDCARLARQLGRLSDSGAGLVITPSRRTPDRLAQAVKRRVSEDSCFWWDGTGENPYGYLLAHADHFVVTLDSANMMGEACVSGKPVHYFTPSARSRKARKFERMARALERYGAVREFGDEGELPVWRYEPLFAADEIAAEIIKRAAHQSG